MLTRDNHVLRVMSRCESNKSRFASSQRRTPPTRARSAFIRWSSLCTGKTWILPCLPATLKQSDGTQTRKESIFKHLFWLLMTMIGLPTKKSKVLRFQICCTTTKYLSEIYKHRTVRVGAAKLFSVNSSGT